MAFAMLDILCSNSVRRTFLKRRPRTRAMKLQKWSDTIAQSKLSPERRARVEAEVD
jgi:hypothetical protein